MAATVEVSGIGRVSPIKSPIKLNIKKMLL